MCCYYLFWTAFIYKLFKFCIKFKYASKISLFLSQTVTEWHPA